MRRTEVALTRAELATRCIVRNPGRVLSRDQLSQAIAGHVEELYGRSIDMHVGGCAKIDRTQRRRG